MKKVYESPVFEFESYQLDEFVANCENTTPNFGPSGCTMDDPSGFGTLFTDSNKNCDVKDSEYGPTDNNGYCYHIPTPGMQYFGS